MRSSNRGPAQFYRCKSQVPDSTHLQKIHRHLYRDLYDWAEEWAHSATAYIYDLGAIQPFLSGNDTAIQEFAVQLASKNNLNLHWDAIPEISSSAMALLSYAEQSANLRRLIMLIMDTGPIAAQRLIRDHILVGGMDLSPVCQ